MLTIGYTDRTLGSDEFFPVIVHARIHSFNNAPVLRCSATTVSWSDGKDPVDQRSGTGTGGA